MKFKNETYDILKWIAMYLLPAIGTLYFALASVWGLPYGEQIVGTVTAIDTFLGVILGISTANYNKDNQAKQTNETKIQFHRIFFLWRVTESSSNQQCIFVFRKICKYLNEREV